MKRKHNNFLILFLILIFLIILFTLFYLYNKNYLGSDDQNQIIESDSVECVAKFIPQDITIKAKGKKIKTNGLLYADSSEINEQGLPLVGNSIADDNWYYSWSGQKGVKMNIKDEYEKNYSLKAWIKLFDKMGVEYNCYDKDFLQDEFEVPKNVEFELMNKKVN